ncbi:hypothetical protein DL96DRAFT_242403 [Flagelloscypha sp. PMI_526]|nr:hypothetical protein DL96DRAFT_242403 [Flagelloscypha sp. PMI_526]
MHLDKSFHSIYSHPPKDPSNTDMWGNEECEEFSRACLFNAPNSGVWDHALVKACSTFYQVYLKELEVWLLEIVVELKSYTTLELDTRRKVEAYQELLERVTRSLKTLNLGTHDEYVRIARPTAMFQEEFEYAEFELEVRKDYLEQIIEFVEHHEHEKMFLSGEIDQSVVVSRQARADLLELNSEYDRLQVQIAKVNGAQGFGVYRCA